MKGVKGCSIGIYVLALSLLSFSLSGVYAGVYSGGDGEPNSPYIISTPENLDEIGNHPNDWDKNFILTADINMADYTYTTALIAPLNAQEFNGVFDGNNHTINSFTINTLGNPGSYLGLFGHIGTGQVSNLNLNNCVIAANFSPLMEGISDNIGAVAGENYGTIINCAAQVNIITNTYSSDSESIGGLVGYNAGTITKCHTEGEISGYQDVGGLVGLNAGSVDPLTGLPVSIEFCYSSCSVYGKSNAGGLAGSNHTSIRSSYATSDVGWAGDETSIGGLVGLNDGEIRNCYATGIVIGDTQAGGLVGANLLNGTVKNSYATGSVTANTKVGGLVGFNYELDVFIRGRIFNSFWDIDTGGPDNGIGTPESTLHMKDIHTFLDAGWDFIDETERGHKDYWQITSGQYPSLNFDPPAFAKYSGGSGTFENPYLISASEDLYFLSKALCWDDWDKYFTVVSDFFVIDNMSPISYEDDYTFTGVFDGNDRSIYNLLIEWDECNFYGTGLFGYINSPNAQVKNLTLVDPNINVPGCPKVGSFVGRLEEGSITNCKVIGGTVSAYDYVGGLIGYVQTDYLTDCNVTDVNIEAHAFIGGLAGYAEDANVINCSASAQIAGGSQVGGLIGHNQNGFIANCTANLIPLYPTFFGHAGGLVGYNEKGTITNCTAHAEIEGSGLGGLVGVNDEGIITDCSASGQIGVGYGGSIGGLIGTNGGWGFTSKVTNCYSTAQVYGSEKVGGLIGMCYASELDNCYATGDVEGELQVGGLIGWEDVSKVSNCYAVGNVDADSVVGGLIGDAEGIYSSCYATGNVSGGDRTGGLLGRAWYAKITNSYATGNVTGNNRTGGLIGSASRGTIINCFTTGYVEGYSDSGNLVGLPEEEIIVSSFWNQDSGSLGFVDNGFGTPLNTEQMQDPNTYLNAGWDCNGYTQNGCQDLWLAEDGNYPQLSLNASDGKYGGGSGESKDPYLIYNPEHFWNIAGSHVDIWKETLDLDKHFKLVRDINLEFLTSNDYRTIGFETDEYHPFTGVFDGNNHTISKFTNLVGDEPGEVMAGLFGYVDDPNAVIKNLTLEDCNITGPAAALVGNLIQRSVRDCNVLNTSLQGDYVGAIASEVENGTISHCHSDVHVTSDNRAGGLVEYLNYGTLKNCSSIVDMKCITESGGLVAFNENGTISNSCSLADISFFGGGRAGQSIVGGLVGNNYSTIINCYALVNIHGHNMAGGLVGLNVGNITQSYTKGSMSGNNTLGGLVGQHGSYSSRSGSKIGTIFDCYSEVAIVGYDKIGGLVGFNAVSRGISSGGNIFNCYSVAEVIAGDISSTNLGGFTGYDDDTGTYTACFWNTDLNPDVNGIGNTTDPNVIGKTTTEMQTKSTFTDAGWDFVGETVNGPNDIWTIKEDVNYPEHVWPLVQFVNWDGVDFLDYGFFADHWMHIDCNDVNDCNSTDLDFSGMVDINDVNIFTNYWLFGK